MSSVIDLCNRALIAVGTRSTIASLTETSTEARHCSRLFDSTRNELLGKAWWNFARNVANLGVLKAYPGTPENPGGVVPTAWNPTLPQPPWLYSYAYPSDCVTARYLSSVQANQSSGVPIFSTTAMTYAPLFNGSAIPFIVAVDQDGSGNDIRVLLTNQSQAILVYTKNVTSTEVWDYDFEQAFVHALAGYLAIPLTGDRAKANDLWKLANDKVMEARASDGNEGLTIQERIPETLRVRGFGGMPLGYVS